MKNTIKTFAILFLLLSYGCKAQQMVQAPNEAHKLKENEQQFLNKPLKNLLKEIKPEIKNVSGNIDTPSYFVYRFVDNEEFSKGISIGKKPLILCVYVKEPLDWKFDERPKGTAYQWTKADVAKYGNLTVIRIRVIGKD
ncbi:hypothetical protein [Flavobacterium sp. 140616W15]|uniref:hypothetical protein n=1 Tax=Flavobacterium sp. 140616W15 TaxID=2478552 RepID=UPI000F0D1CBF|nr:hypothetical protein [Flavobacterium sp. 140616W15]AYN05059.1 hypothetical protein EAG11_13560 [Flavobacterium sp. 140616W15]